MTKETHQLLLRALDSVAGDDLERAQRAFRYCTDEMMDEEYGQSGKARRQILAEYEDHRRRVNVARAELMKEPVE